MLHSFYFVIDFVFRPNGRNFHIRMQGEAAGYGRYSHPEAEEITP
jgi:hypothetical protein